MVQAVCRAAMPGPKWQSSYTRTLGNDNIEQAGPDFRGQRGGRRGGVVAAAETSEDAKFIEVLASKNMTLAQLIHFYKKKEEDGRLGPASTCWDVLRDVIIPDTAAEAVAYMDIVMGSPKRPGCMVSHWWGTNFREVVLAVAQHATDILARDVLEKKTFSAGLAHAHLEKTYWLCMFAANHHSEKTRGHPMLSVPTLDAVIVSSTCFLLVLDAELGALSRAWCAFEVFQAHAAGKPLDFAAGHLGSRFINADVEVPLFELCDTWEPQDKAFLMQHCESEIGMTAFNSAFRELARDGVINVAWREVAGQGDVAAMRGLLTRKANVDWVLTRARGTALVWAAEHDSGTDVLQFLLEHKANPNATALGGWSPLLYATQLGNEEAVRALLAALVDPLWAAQTGRTALLEATERGYDKLAELLLEARAEPDLEKSGTSTLHLPQGLDGPWPGQQAARPV